MANEGQPATALDRLVAENERLREEVDALRDFILSGPMSAESYCAFKKIPSYVDQQGWSRDD